VPVTISLARRQVSIMVAPLRVHHNLYHVARASAFQT